MIKLPKGVRLLGKDGVWYRGEIPCTTCHSHHAEKYAPKKQTRSRNTEEASK